MPAAYTHRSHGCLIKWKHKKINFAGCQMWCFKCRQRRSLGQKSTKIVGGWGSAHTCSWATHDAPPEPLMVWGGASPLSKPRHPRRLRRLDFLAFGAQSDLHLRIFQIPPGTLDGRIYRAWMLLVLNETVFYGILVKIRSRCWQYLGF